MKEKKGFLTLEILSQYKSELYGITILWIMLFHSYLVKVYYFKDAGAPLDYIHTIINHGNMGCDMFLFLSGIFCFYSFAEKQRILQYEKKRYFRLVIPVLFINGFYWLTVLLMDGDLGKFFLRVTLTDFWVTGDQQIWFVSLIWMCYLLYPLIFYILYDKNKNLRVGNLCLIIVLVTGMILLLKEYSPELYARWEIAINRIPVFILGCGLGRAVRDRRRLKSVFVLAAFLIILASLWMLHDFEIRGMIKRYFYICGIAYVIFFAAVLKKINLKPFNKILAFFGDMSLQLYLAHILLRRLYAESIFYVPGSKINYFFLLAIATVIAYRLEQLLRDLIQEKRNK